MAYNGSIELISGIKQKNGGDFPLVDASAVRVDDETRLDTIIAELTEQINDVILEATIDNLVESIFATGEAENGGGGDG